MKLYYKCLTFHWDDQQYISPPHTHTPTTASSSAEATPFCCIILAVTIWKEETQRSGNTMRKTTTAHVILFMLTVCTVLSTLKKIKKKNQITKIRYLRQSSKCTYYNVITISPTTCMLLHWHLRDKYCVWQYQANLVVWKLEPSAITQHSLNEQRGATVLAANIVILK